VLKKSYNEGGEELEDFSDKSPPMPQKKRRWSLWKKPKPEIPEANVTISPIKIVPKEWTSTPSTEKHVWLHTDQSF